MERKREKLLIAIHRVIGYLCWIGMAGIVFGLFYAHYAIWRAQHPDAPTWTYLFHK